MNVLDFGMNVQAAIAAARVSFLEPDFLGVERTFPASLRVELERRGHRLRESGGFGDVHGLTIEWGPDGRPARFHGGADPRGAGTAAGPPTTR